ncbi:(deoxy)nucleoside triphosphate pyrophosphohydrolase [Microbacterium immunditiarum]|uniref:8-oxo-dGTP diphosphatase n=1 Tax=Microbacterium immunditiarum TaxID=337480 RepID=A0A7Y9GLJ9_9MICO|nr:8-oxo-dGTP diphosphatase [Microbacterium immunditiarum]
MSDALPTIDVVAAVVERDGAFLACRRAAGRAAAGKWEFPGGKVEASESPADALVREIREELGVSIEVAGELVVVEPGRDGGIRLICLHARLEGPPPVASTDHDELRWVARDELAALDWAEPDVPAVRLLADGTAG